MKYYAVQKGIKPGIYTNWSECEANVKGVAGAVYKSFKSLEEAEAFLGKDGYDKKSTSTHKSAKSNSKSSTTFDISKYTGPIAFVDGSFNSSTNEYGYGVVVIEDTANPIEVQFSGKDNKEDFLVSNNVAGEVTGAMIAISYAIERGYTEITICHDYKGVCFWATGEWAAEKPVSIAYKSFINTIKDKIKVSFVHVKAHSGIYYNDMVDALAKDSLNIPLEKKMFEELIHSDLETSNRLLKSLNL